MLGTAARSWPGVALLAVSTLLALYVRHDALRSGVLRWESRGVAGTSARAYWLDAHGTLPADRGMGAANDRPRRAWRPGTRADPTYPNLCSTSSAAAATACNGHEEYCSRTYSNVSVIGAHDSYSVGAGNSAPFSLPRVEKADAGSEKPVAANQNYTVTTQLDNGIRMLQVSRRTLSPNRSRTDDISA